jgi:hypothetical protein
MPDPAEFEEKEYEIPLYLELVQRPGRLWTPGQVLEAKLGFDGAVQASQRFWKHVGRCATPGVILAAFGLEPLGLPPSNGLPDFRLNLFLQCKRPERYRRHPAVANKNGLSAPCRFFGINADQQGVLQSLESHLAGCGDVSYACASFDTRQQLFQYSRARTLVPMSTFPPIGSLKGHKRWLFSTPGATGVAHSEPEVVEVPILDQRLENAWSAAHGQATGDNGDDITAQLRELWRRIAAVLREFGPGGFAGFIIDEANGAAGSGDDWIAFALRIATASMLLGLSWHVLGPEHAEWYVV